MSKGRKWPSETTEYTDRETGARVRRLTDYKGHSHHPYFTNPGWCDGDRRLLFSSDRENRTNLYSIELATGEITQLTDFAAPASPDEFVLLALSVNPKRPECYFWYCDEMIALDLESLETRTIYHLPDAFRRGMLNCTADGRHVCTGLSEDLSDRIHMDFGRGYVGFAEYSAAKPESRIEVVSTDGFGSRTAWREDYWIGHVNTSPTQDRLLTFCHEGPWENVDHRIWGLDIDEGKPWKIRPYRENERVGHEYWYADGERLGYHGSFADGRQFIGHIRHDNTGRVEMDFPYLTGHTHSNDEHLIVGDGGKVVRLWRRRGDSYDGPKMLCRHRGSFQIQQLHVHPRFTRDGKEVLFTSDISGYGNVYLAEVPDFDSLPRVQEE